MTRHCFLAVMICALGNLAVTGGTSASEGVSVQFTSDRTKYFVREPMIFTISIANGSSDTVRVPDPMAFDNNMDHFFLEVMGPEGETSYRRNRYLLKSSISNPGYRGEPLPPGASIRTVIYPIMSHQTDPVANSIESGTLRLTFPHAGRYLVRVHYWVTPEHPLLWHPSGTSLPSNSVVLEIEEPAPEDKEILDAIWAEGGSRLSMGDKHAIYPFDEEALRRVITRFPDNRLAKLAKFYLASSLARPKHNPRSVETTRRHEAIDLLNELQRENPGFRTREISYCLGIAYLDLNEKRLALETIRRTLELRPEFRDDPGLMNVWFHADDDPSSTRGRWIRDRRKGNHLRQMREE